MKKFVYEEQKACVMKLNNKRVWVQKFDNGDFNLGFKRLGDVNKDPIFFTDIVRTNGVKEITRCGFWLSPEAAVALYFALGEAIKLDDIPKDLLNVESL